MTYNPFGERLERLRTERLLRRLRTFDSPPGRVGLVDGEEKVQFGSNDYLGLAHHPALRQAAIEATDRYGWGSGASRLVSGTTTPHARFEEEIASFLGKEAALLFANGYGANVGLMTALCGRGDTVYADRLAHASLLDGIRFSGARLVRFQHNDAEHLAHLLARREGEKGNRFVVTEGVFSMDGDRPPLAAIAEAAHRHGAVLIVDDAHGVGLFGPDGRGTPHDLGVADQVDVHIITLGKAFGGAGGVIAGSRGLIDGLLNFARPFIYSTAPPPAQASAASAALAIIAGEEGERSRRRLFALVERFVLRAEGFCYTVKGSGTPILPLFVEGELVAVGKALLEEGYFAPAIRPPTVPIGTARFRVSLTAGHTDDDIDRFWPALRRAEEAVMRHEKDC